MIMIADKDTINQVLGALMRRPQFLGESDKYTLTIDDFNTSFEKLIFGAIYVLYDNGSTVIHPIDIENKIGTDLTKKKIFEQNNGLEYLLDIEELASVESFNYYYNKLKKYNLLRDLKKMGIDTSCYLAEDPAQRDAEKINQEFDSKQPDDFIKDLKVKLLGLEHNYSQADDTEVESAAFNLDELIENIEEKNDIGLPLQGIYYNEIVGGARLGALYVRSASSGVGKALPNSTIIPTPNGYKRVDEIKIGDYLFDAFGKPTKVLGVYPQGKKEVNFVRFKDGRIAKCCDEHLWSYCTVGQKSTSKNARQFYTKTLQEIKKMPLKNTDGAYNILIPMNYAVEYEPQNFYIPPYIFGLALGDGSFRQHDTNKAFEYSSENDILPNIIGSTMGWIVKRGSKNNNTWYFANKNRKNNQYDKINIWVEDFLKEYPELINLTSIEKYIPNKYLYSSINQRFDLLNGLLDSDGSVDNKGRISYYTISSKLCDNVIELCRSLGFKTNVIIDEHKTTNICYRIDITGRPADKNKLFKLPRKRDLMQKWFDSASRKESNNFNPIIEIGSCGYSEDMTCFYVDNYEHLFLMNDYIVTHNTRQAVGDACYLAYPCRYNWAADAWEMVGSNKKCLFIATEQSIQEIQKMILAYLSGIEESKFRYACFTAAEERVIQQAKKVMEFFEKNFYIVRMPNPTIELIKNRIRENVLTKEIEYVFYDYIFVGPALLNEFKGFNIRNDEALLMMATALKDLAVELKVCIMTSTQVNANAENTNGIRNESAIAGSRSIINKADIGVMAMRPTKEELDIWKELKLGENVPELPNIVTDVYKVRSGQWTQVRIWSAINLGTLRRTDICVTDAQFNVINNIFINGYINEMQPFETKEVMDFLKGLGNGLE